MAVRILHCGQSVENYVMCIEHHVAGFKRRAAELGDVIYLAVRVNDQTLCGARGRLDCLTDTKPWEDADLYIQCFDIADLEFCEPFPLNVLGKRGVQNWSVRYLQQPRPIADEEARAILIEAFNSGRRDTAVNLKSETALSEADRSESLTESVEVPVSEGLGVEDDSIRIMGTFQTIKFQSETHTARGLEPLVNANFHSLFPHFAEDRTILLAENRLFRTASAKNSGGETVADTGGIPDAVLLVNSSNAKSPFQINLIEYECFGESKVRLAEKTTYLNGHIIPQLMRFAAAFSIVTDSQLRKRTIDKWADKMAEQIDREEDMRAKVSGWIRKTNPDIPERRLYHQLQELLKQAFCSNLRVMLIIDELTGEQRDTIKNIISAFKLENEQPVGFMSYVVRLEQRISIKDQTADYALSFQ